MEEKRDQEELKHVCKLCNKRYPSGKSLGGHMRSHVIANSRKNKPIILPKKAPAFHYDDDGDEDEDEDEYADEEIIAAKHSGYGLRENPKKTWRLVGSTLKSKQLLPHFQPQGQQQQQQVVGEKEEEEGERVCKQCGKGFKSLKALCGHMSSHTERERVFKEEDDYYYSWSSDTKAKSKRETRASLSRYKSIVTTAATPANGVESFSVSPNGGGNGSSSNHSEIDQHEQEEVALCLMMLSRDSSSVHFNFTATTESSDDDNNSVILEGGSSSTYAGIKRKHFGLVNHHADDTKVKAKVKVKGKVVGDDEMDNSDSGYFENGAKELESDGSVDGNYGFSKPNLEFRSRLLAPDSFNFGFESDANCSTKKMGVKQDCYSNSCYTNTNSNSNNVVSKKGSKYECGVCKKTFNTHQALGGHIISHNRKINNGDYNNTTLLETNTTTSASTPKISAKKVVVATNSKANKTSKGKKVKGHMCPFCPKVFKSGQALGGHKRSHMMGSSSNYVGNLSLERAALPPRHQQEQPQLLDLNLPAPMDDEASGSGSGSGNSQFVAW